MTKMHAPAALRNRQPILEVLDRYLDAECRVLEIASGSGEHASFFCDQRPNWDWIPSDPSADARASIEAYRRESESTGFQAPLALDMQSLDELPSVDAVVCINMIHISPWSATLGLMTAARACLRSGGVLVTYGPYRFAGEFLADSNRSFDQSLRQRDPEWGVRNAEDIESAARAEQLEPVERVALPANNHALVFRRA